MIFKEILIIFYYNVDTFLSVNWRRGQDYSRSHFLFNCLFFILFYISSEPGLNPGLLFCKQMYYTLGRPGP